MRNQRAKDLMLSYSGTQELVRIMAAHSYAKLSLVCLKIVRNLSTCKANKQELIALNAMHVMCKYLPNDQIRQECLFAMRNLSDAVTQSTGYEQLIEQLLLLLDRGNNMTEIRYSVEILSNLTCKNPGNKLLVCEKDGIRILIKTCRMAEDNEEITEPAVSGEVVEIAGFIGNLFQVCSLRHVTLQHAEESKAQNEVRLVDGKNCFGRNVSG